MSSVTLFCEEHINNRFAQYSDSRKADTDLYVDHNEQYRCDLMSLMTNYDYTE